MSAEEGSNNTGGVSFLGLLAIVFIVMKLMGYITWSWLWVLAPLWMPLAIVLMIVAIAALLSSIGERG